jgi:hypothetical protein
MRIKNILNMGSIIRLPISIVCVALLVHGCAQRPWVMDHFDEPEQALDPKKRLKVYDKKLSEMLAVGRCVMNTKRSVARLVEEDAEILLLGFPWYYRNLRDRQQALISDRQRIREVVAYTTPDENNLLVPYSHLSPFATLWYDTITPSDWRDIDDRYAQLIHFLNDMSEHAATNYGRMLVEDPATDRSALLKPLFCTSAITELVDGVRLDYPKFFDQEDRASDKPEKVVEPSNWFQRITNMVPRMKNLVASTIAPSHVEVANRIGGYRAECGCYTQAQAHYRTSGARFFRQHERYGDSLCGAVNGAEIAELESNLRRYVSQTNRLQRDASDFLGRFAQAEDDPLDIPFSDSLMSRLDADSRSLFNVARAQFSSAQRNRTLSSLQHAKEALICFYDAKASALGRLYLAAEFVEEGLDIKSEANPL